MSRSEIEFPRMAYLAATYFYQGYDAEGTPEQNLRTYTLQERQEAVAGLRGEVDLVLRKHPSEPSLRTLWVQELDAYYEPDRDGLTYRQWFERMRDILSESNPADQP